MRHTTKMRGSGLVLHELVRETGPYAVAVTAFGTASTVYTTTAFFPPFAAVAWMEFRLTPFFSRDAKQCARAPALLGSSYCSAGVSRYTILAASSAFLAFFASSATS